MNRCWVLSRLTSGYIFLDHLWHKMWDHICPHTSEHTSTHSSLHADTLKCSQTHTHFGDRYTHAHVIFGITLSVHHELGWSECLLSALCPERGSICLRWTHTDTLRMRRIRTARRAEEKGLWNDELLLRPHTSSCHFCLPLFLLHSKFKAGCVICSGTGA